MQKYKIKVGGVPYAPRKGGTPEKIEKCLSPSKWKTAEQICDETKLPLWRVKEHLHYQVKRGHLEGV